MSYKKQSPFASFRDPKRATRNFNPTDFQMPDINSIFNKTADGENIEEPKKEDDTDPENDINGPLLDDIKKNQKVEDVTRKSLRQDRRAEEKEINKKIRQARGLKNASTKDITAEKRGEAEDKFNYLKDEKAFRKRAKKAGFNPEDYRNLKVEPSKVLAKKFNKENISPNGEVNISGNNLSLTDSNLPVSKPLDLNNTGDYFMNKFNPKEEEGSGFFTKRGEQPFQMNIKNMKQIKTKGSGFPMIQPNQNMAEQQQVPNRAGRSAESNTLTNDPNITQPMNKVPASSFQRNAQFNDIASGQGVPNPQPQQMATTTPPAPIFPQQQQQGSFAAYSNPSRAINTTGEEIEKGSRKMQESVKDLGDSFSKKEDNKEDAPGMYNGPSKALVGNQENLNEGLKAAIKDSPGMYGEGPSMRSAFKAFENDHLKTKVTKGNLKATERDDAAHMSYLKRDVKYDNTHGGSNRQMLDDEKHISKLAGDLKYDARKKIVKH